MGRLDLGRYHAPIEAVEGGAGRNHTEPQLLVSLWLYAYSRGISSAREVARQWEFEPGFQWLCGLQAISHRTLSGFRSENKAALDGAPELWWGGSRTNLWGTVASILNPQSSLNYKEAA